MDHNTPKPSEFARFWPLDEKSVFLNHGSFGACTKFVLDKQTQYRRRLESQPVRFLAREMETMFNASRQKVAEFIHAKTEDLVFVPNATAGVNTVFRSLRFNPGDEILYTNRLTVLPSPNNGTFTLLSTEPMDAVSVTDLTGKVLQTISSPSQKQAITISGAKPGLYLLKVRFAGSGQDVTTRVVVE